MDMRTRTMLLWSGVAVLVVGGVIMLILSLRSPKETTELDVNAIYTNAAATVVAQQLTLQVGTFVATPTPPAGSPTAALSTLPSPTLGQLTPVLLPTIKPATGGVVTGCDSAVYVSDVTIPDGKTIPAGESFTKTWKVKNIGSCAWTATYQLVYVSGDSLGGKATAVGKVVNPGETADVSVVLTSTSATGSIKGTWKLSNDKGQTFGDSLTVVITNGVTTPTKTPTGSVSGTSTPTPTPTSTTAAYPNP